MAAGPVVMHILDPHHTCASSMPTDMQALLMLWLNMGSSDSSQWHGLAVTRAVCLSLRFPPLVGTCAMSFTLTHGGGTCSSPWSPAQM